MSVTSEFSERDNNNNVAPLHVLHHRQVERNESSHFSEIVTHEN